MDSGTIHKEIN
ncbi:hypothetical protein F383_11986 [Gossypium arboreum]|uniref:Uncharacterized protein n=1 Tax=Gossypium arboreum TaxID=29729 RepID=A0A0B0NDD9_GOSAR|nr:hypothetical protein F383_11986 [Gossypium arboreum]